MVPPTRSGRPSEWSRRRSDRRRGKRAGSQWHRAVMPASPRPRGVTGKIELLPVARLDPPPGRFADRHRLAGVRVARCAVSHIGPLQILALLPLYDHAASVGEAARARNRRSAAALAEGADQLAAGAVLRQTGGVAVEGPVAADLVAARVRAAEAGVGVDAVVVKVAVLRAEPGGVDGTAVEVAGAEQLVVGVERAVVPQNALLHGKSV